MSRSFNILVHIVGQQYMFTLTEPPPLYSLANFVFTTFSWQVEIGNGFNKHVQITGQQYAHMTCTLFSYQQILEILPFPVCIGDHDRFSISHAEIMQMSKEIIVLKDILNEL